MLLRIYRALIRSKLDYGCLICASAKKADLRTLNTIQNAAISLDLGAFRTSPIESIQIKCGEPSLWIRRQQLQLCFAIKLASNKSKLCYEATFNQNNDVHYMNHPKSLKSLHQMMNSVNYGINFK